MGPLPASCIRPRQAGRMALIPRLTIEIVEGHDNIQVGTQDLTKLVDQGRVIGWVNCHVVTRFIPRGRGGSGDGQTEGGSVPRLGGPK